MIDWKKIRAVGIDLDGVVYLGNELVPGADRAIERFREREIRIYFLTNNSARTREAIASKLGRMGVRCAPGEILNSAHAAAERARTLGFTRVLVVGTAELKREFEASGIRPEADARGAELVVVGYNPEFTYADLARATEAVLGGAKLLACNRDRTYPVEGGILKPGCGPLVAAVEYATRHEADFVAGKPDPWLLEMARQASGAKASELVMIGDTPDSDIAMAARFGCSSILVGPGSEAHASSPTPTLRWNSLADALEQV